MLSLVYFFDVLFCSSSLPPSQGGKMSHCSGNMSGLVVMVEFYLWLSLDLSFGIEEGGDGLGLFPGDGLKFF